MALVVVGFARFGSGGRRRDDAGSEPRLPQGAEAALWSILEAVPDPRNHLALTRDLSGEVRITDLDRHLAASTVTSVPPTPVEVAPIEQAEIEPAPVDAEASEPAVAANDEATVDVREMVDDYYDFGTIALNEPLTDHFFTGADS